MAKIQPQKPRNGWGQGRWLPTDEYMGKCMELHFQELAALHETVSQQTASRKEQLEELLVKAQQAYNATGDDDANFTIDSFVDDLYSSETQLRWSTLLQVVATYHYLEGEIGVLFGWVFSGVSKVEENRLLRKIHKWDDLETLLNEWCNVSRSTLNCQSKINELRVVCNSIKHTGGKVSSELAVLMGWTVDDPINYKKLDLKEYRNSATGFLTDMIAKVEAGLQGKYGPAP